MKMEKRTNMEDKRGNGKETKMEIKTKIKNLD